MSLNLIIILHNPKHSHVQTKVGFAQNVCVGRSLSVRIKYQEGNKLLKRFVAEFNILPIAGITDM